MRLVIEGAPRTKKNSQRIIRAGRRARIIQSSQYLAWEDHAVMQLIAQAHKARGADRQRNVLTSLTPSDKVNMRAIVYRDRRAGDLLNFLAAISDALELAGIVEDDKLIVTVDGSRLRVDRQRPRVDIELTPARADFGEP